MAYVQKGYIGDSSVNAKLNNGNTKITNGVVSKAYGGVGTNGQNLRDVGYPNTYPTGSGVAGAKTSNSRSTGSGSGSGSSSASNLANAYSALLAAYKQNDYSDYLAQMRAAAQSAYDRGMSALNSAYDNQMNSLNSNLNETKNTLLNQYNRSKQNIADDAASSLRQAYVNSMQNRRNLGQQMSAMGLTGGATESTLANMLNSYGNARNEINTTQSKNLSNLEGNYSDNLSQAMQAYNSAVANANLQKAQQAMSLENALANNQISALGDYTSLMQRENQNYLDLLKAAISAGAKFNYDPTKVVNNVNGLAMTQGSMPTTANNLAAVQALLNSQQTPGGGGAAISISNPTVDNNYLQQILAQLRG